MLTQVVRFHIFTYSLFMIFPSHSMLITSETSLAALQFCCVHRLVDFAGFHSGKVIIQNLNPVDV
jgi:hypothetical protein